MPEITPVQLAKKLDMRPQIIYSLIKRGQIVAWRNSRDKTVVDEEKATRRIQSPQKRGRPARDPDEEIQSPVRKGQTVSWSYKNGRKVATVLDANDGLIRLWTDTRQEVFFRYKSFKQCLDDDKIAIHNPWDLLEVIAEQWQTQGQTELAESLTDWLVAHRSQSSELAAPDQSNISTPELVAAT